MTMSNQMSDASVLEQHKENIQPLPGGRYGSKLANTLSQTSKSVTVHKDQIKREREQHERILRQHEELDDPLQAFIDYISWTHENFTQGNNAESGLLTLLERCTSCFRDASHYKNDPRYLKVWLEYTNYSDSPRDIFVYLAKKEIGNQLALYYEEFAEYLEINGKITDADEIYQLGINSKARPLQRLERSYQYFKKRIENNSNAVNNKRSGLEITQGKSTHEFQDGFRSAKRPRLEIYKDDSDNDQSVLKSIFNGETANNDLGSIKSRIKENTLPSKPWSGEILKQRNNSDRILPPSSSSSSSKFQVFRDQENEHQYEQTTQTILEDKSGLSFTLIKHPGKRAERVLINLDLLYLSDEEISIEEMLARTRSVNRTTTLQSQPYNNIEDNNTFVIPLKDEDDSTLPNRPNSPTMTMFSRQANQEVIKLFNEAAINLNSDDEIERMDVVDSTSTNYDGFVTETIQVQEVLNNNNHKSNLPSIETPPTDKEDDGNVQSSPFIEQPMSDNMSVQIISNFNNDLRNNLINKLKLPLDAYPGYSNSNFKVSKLHKLLELTSHDKKSINKGAKNSIIDFCGDEIYCLRYELGKGGFGVVYLIEAGSTGDLKALKVESPSSKWEFYILNQIHQRLQKRQVEDEKLFINPLELYTFQDESYLIMDYCCQGTILDVVNHFKNKHNSAVEEVICIYLTIELLKMVEVLHSIGILHGDLKADNCMLRLEADDHWSEQYNRYGLDGWSKKSLTLIDFGRSVDLELFNDNVQFLSNWKTDQQDCPQMNKGEPWSYEADYYGIASIIHTMLFGTYIKIKQLTKIELEAPLKRYWQQELWNTVFDLLLNPYKESEEFLIRKQPLSEKLILCRRNFETWLEDNCKKRMLKKYLQDLEYDLNLMNKKRIG
ncbi:Mad3/BUB1 homology region 1-domain-containing protein [Scheffersomyces coipomensis]|uniref:Mad3/BUB1 homology region 1-domain-containing protein n=1 Tax=Scheffersomyces coipomensis TaxID=1788519 RepID=UPI00315CB0FE